MNATVDRQLRRAARAFPRRWRAEREDELVATAVEMLAPDAERVPLGVQADIVRAGWSERHRAHPPLGRWLLYCASGKLPARYHLWLHDDLDGPLYWLRAAVRRYTLMVTVWFTMFAVLNATNGTSTPPPWSATIGFLVLVPLSWALRDRMRRQVRKQHRIGPAAPGSPLPAPTPVWMPARTASMAVRPLAVAYACFGAVATALFLWRAQALDEHTTVPLHTWLVVAAAALAGVGGAVVVARRAQDRAGLAARRPVLSSRDLTLRLTGALALSTVVLAFWLTQLKQGSLFPNATLLAALSALLTVVAGGAATLRTTVTVADLLASREQLLWLKQQEMVSAG